MQIRSLRMSNWRPFYGVTDMDLETDVGRPMIWVHGNNMRGKTSILNAVRWCLYGTTLDSGRERHPHLNINKDAVAEGDYHMEVILGLSHNDKEYELARHVQWSSPPMSQQGMVENLSLRVDHQIQSPGEVGSIIQDMLHPTISQFYLFDGEMIREFEDRLSSDRRQAAFVRRAIEQVVGLPALILGADDLEYLSTETTRTLNRQLREEQKHRRITDELEGIAEALGVAKTDVEKHTALEGELENRLRDLRQTQSQLAEVNAQLRERDVLRDELDDLQRQREVLASKLRATLSEEWWIPAAALIRARREEHDRAMAARLQRETRIEVLEERVRELASSLEKKSCSTCGHDLSGDKIASLEIDMARLQRELAPIRQMSADDTLTGTDAGVLRSFGEVQALSLVDHSEQIVQLDLKIHDRKGRITRLERGIKESDEADAAQTQRDLEATHEKLATVRDRLETARNTVSALEAQQKQKRSEITSLPGVASRTRIRLTLLDGLTTLFRAAIDEFRDAVRASVESRASELFNRFTTEPDFSGVRINEDYALTILDHEGRPVAPSVGAQQVLALSLIGGLNASAVREGPLVIDTPLARFDPGHRRNIVGHLGELGTQVILLIQPGEFDRNLYLKEFGDNVTREFTVERITDQRSRVVGGFKADALLI